MRRYATGLLLFSILIMVFGFLSGKITLESFRYISVPELLLAVFKSLIVVLILLLALAAALPAFLIDLVLFLLAGYDFLLLRNLWEVCWQEVTLGWFWTETGGSSIFFGALILLVISSLLMRRR